MFLRNCRNEFYRYKVPTKKKKQIHILLLFFWFNVFVYETSVVRSLSVYDTVVSICAWFYGVVVSTVRKRNDDSRTRRKITHPSKRLKRKDPRVVVITRSHTIPNDVLSRRVPERFEFFSVSRVPKYVFPFRRKLHADTPNDCAHV